MPPLPSTSLWTNNERHNQGSAVHPLTQQNKHLVSWFNPTCYQLFTVTKYAISQLEAVSTTLISRSIESLTRYRHHIMVTVSRSVTVNTYWDLFGKFCCHNRLVWFPLDANHGWTKLVLHAAEACQNQHKWVQKMDDHFIISVCPVGVR